MADWTDIQNSEIDGDSPITESLMASLRDNPVAIAENAIGAPEIVTGAIDNATATHDFGSNVLTQGWNGGDGNYQITTVSTYNIPAGWYLAYVDAPAGGYFEVYIDGSWRVFVSSGTWSGMIISDWANVRIRNVSAVTTTFHYKKLTA